MAPTLYQEEFLDGQTVALLGQTDALKEEYYAIFAERMIQHPAVKGFVKVIFPHYLPDLSSKSHSHLFSLSDLLLLWRAFLAQRSRDK